MSWFLSVSSVWCRDFLLRLSQIATYKASPDTPCLSPLWCSKTIHAKPRTYDYSTYWCTTILPHWGPCLSRLDTSWKMEWTCRTHSMAPRGSGFVKYMVHFHDPSNPNDMQQPITEVVNKANLTSEKFRGLSNSWLPTFGRSTPGFELYSAWWDVYTSVKYENYVFGIRVCRVSFVSRVFLLPDHRPWTLGFHNMIFLEPVAV